MSISLLRYDATMVTPKDDAVLFDFFSGQTGIISGCEITHLGANQLQITAGRGIIKGRDFVVTQQTILATVADSGTKQGRLLIEIDIENTSTPIVFKTQMGTTLPALTQEEINDDGTVYQLPLAAYSISTTTISGLNMINNTLTSPGQSATAANVSIADENGYFDSGTVEGALQEIGAKIAPILDHVVGAIFTRSTAQSVVSGSQVSISWTSQPVDLDDSFEAGQPTRMYCRKTGYYFLGAKAEITLSNAGPFHVYLWASRGGFLNSNTVYGSQALMNSISTGMVYLEAGDYVTFDVLQSDGASRNVSYCNLWMMRVAV